MTMRASTTARCVTEVPTLEGEVQGARLAPSSSWGSWCNLGQTHERRNIWWGGRGVHKEEEALNLPEGVAGGFPLDGFSCCDAGGTQ